MNRRRALQALLASVFAAPVATRAADGAGIGAVVMHGKWGTPRGPAAVIAAAFERAGMLVASPEMPWSRQRQYDATVEAAMAEVEAEVARLEQRGAKRVFVVGHSLGAAFALHYAERKPVAGVVAVAPGHRPEGAKIAEMLRSDVATAKSLVAAGKSQETVSFTDFNSGNRRQRMTIGAAALVSYFDPEGPMNMQRNAARFPATVPILWLVPTREEAFQRRVLIDFYKTMGAHPESRLAEPESDHLNAPDASARIAIDWMQKVAGR